MHRYLVVIKDDGSHYSAYLPDLPGCAAEGATREEVEANIQEAIRAHINGMLKDGKPIPESRCCAEYVILEEQTSS